MNITINLDLTTDQAKKLYEELKDNFEPKETVFHFHLDPDDWYRGQSGLRICAEGIRALLNFTHTQIKISLSPIPKPGYLALTPHSTYVVLGRHVFGLEYPALIYLKHWMRVRKLDTAWVNIQEDK